MSFSRPDKILSPGKTSRMGFIKDKTLGLFVRTNGLLSDPIYGGIGACFVLHRVLPPALRDKYTINRGLAITPEYLERVIHYLQQKNCRFVSLDELCQVLESGQKPKHKLICLTIDDGYRDNMEFGLPVFQKHNIPFTIYVTNCFPEHTALLWWYWLEAHIAQHRHLILETPEALREFEWQSEEQGAAMFMEMRAAIMSIPKRYFAKTLKAAFGKTDEDIKTESAAVALTWDEVRQLSSEKLVNIGAHTMNHLSCRTLTDDELEYELGQSRQMLELKTGSQIEHFAFPYGGVGEAWIREYAVARKHYKTTTLNIRGNISMQQLSHLECIPRMAVGNSTTTQKLDEYLNGITHFSDNGFKKYISY